MIDFEWKSSERLLHLIAKVQGILVWDKFSSNERCALHELFNKGLIVIYRDLTNHVRAVRLTEKGLQEIFIEQL